MNKRGKLHYYNGNKKQNTFIVVDGDPFGQVYQEQNTCVLFLCIICVYIINTI